MAEKGKRGNAANPSTTARDVAKALNISQSTVSRAFTPGASISPALRDQIYAMAEKIGYRPNLLARGLIAGKSKLIGVVLAQQTNLLYPELLYELSGQLAERGYQVLLFPINESIDIQGSIERIWAYRVDAVLATGILEEEEVLSFKQHNLPILIFNRTMQTPVPCVSCDFASGARDLTSRLIEAGHKSLGLISGPASSYVGNEVERGARLAIGGHPDISLTVVRATYRYDEAASAVSALKAANGSLPEAILCANDTVAAGCVDHLRSALGLRIPEDISVVTFGGFGPSAWQSYQLTAMQQPMEEMTAAAVESLLKHIDDPLRSPERRHFLPRFMRGATATLKDD